MSIRSMSSGVVISVCWRLPGRRRVYLFNLEELIPASHLLRRINPVVTRVLAERARNSTPFYSDIGRPSIDAIDRKGT